MYKRQVDNNIVSLAGGNPGALARLRLQHHAHSTATAQSGSSQVPRHTISIDLSVPQSFLLVSGVPRSLEFYLCVPTSEYVHVYATHPFALSLSV